MGLQDTYGIYNPASTYGDEIHIPDQLIGIAGMIFGYIGTVILYTIPRTSEGHFTLLMGKIPMLIAITIVIAAAAISQNLDSTMKTCGTTKACLSLLAYLPQMYNNYKNKSTFGFSHLGVYMDFGGGCLAIVQLFIDYYRDSANTDFEKDLNYGKFFLNTFTCIACAVF
jgi:hypothetical protein